MRTVLPLLLLLCLGCSADKARTKGEDSLSAKSETPPPTENNTEVSFWREDLQYLAATLPKVHTQLYHDVSKEDFDVFVSQLDLAIAGLNTEEIIVEFSRLMAMVGDGHTLLQRKFIPYLQLNLYWFEEGIYVREAPKKMDWAIGQKVTHIDGMPVEEAIAKLSPLISADNDSHRKAQMPNSLIDSTLLFGLGISKRQDRASYRLVDALGKSRTLEIVLGQTVVPSPSPEPLSLSRQNNHLNYWSHFDSANQSFYIQYNRCQDSQQRTILSFSQDVLAELTKTTPKRLVIDLRNNGGGNSLLIKPLIDGLVDGNLFSGKGELFVIIGRHTFSSAILNAIELKDRLGALWVGEASGGKPSHFGEVETFDLPKSQLKVMYATKYFSFPDRPEDSLMPDILVPVKHESYRTGVDEAMQRIMAYEK